LSAGAAMPPSEAGQAGPAQWGNLRRTLRMGYHSASLLHLSQREAKFRPGNPGPESARPTFESP